MITGFRWDLKGAQNMYNLDPDISNFGKAMANGFSVSAVCGKKKFMELGSIEKKGRKRLFLLSSTHGAEMNSLAAMNATMSEVKKKKIINKIWKYGYNLKRAFNDISEKNNLKKFLYMDGVACSPYYITKNIHCENCFEMRTVFQHLMIKEKIFMPWVSLSAAHNENIFKKTIKALEKVMPIYKKALNGNIKKYIHGNIIKPVFREYN